MALGVWGLGLLGWIARTPPQKTSWRLWAAIRAGQRCLYRANRHLGAITYGGNTHLDCLVGCNLLRLVKQAYELGSQQWHRKAGTTLRALRDYLCQRGWTEHRPWQWKGPDASCDISLTGRQELGTLQHRFRQGWRHDQWCRFLWSGRHETEELWDTSTQEFLQIDFDRTRKAMAHNAAAESVALCATASPACFQEHQQVAPKECCWPNCQKLGTWKHVAWDCKRKPPLPQGIVLGQLKLLQKRLGWIRKSQGQGDEKVLAWLAKVQEQIWDARFSSMRPAGRD